MELVLGGLAIGSVYSLVAIGIVLSYRAAGVNNFAHGELVMISAYAYVLMHDLTGSPFWEVVAALGAGAAGGLLCFVLTGVILRGSAEITLIIATLGLLILFQSTARHLFTDTPLRAEAWVFGERDVALFNALVPANSLLILGVTVLATALLVYWQRATVFGQAVLAAAEDPWRAADNPLLARRGARPHARALRRGRPSATRCGRGLRRRGSSGRGSAERLRPRRVGRAVRAP